MRQEDLTVFEYRMSKEVKNTDEIMEERLHGKYEKGSVPSKTAGYVDFMIYRPEGYNGTDVLPAVFSFHGGGFVLGYYETDGKYCQKLADLSGCAVINVDYPLAPEFKFPKPLLASYEAVTEVVKRAEYYHLDKDNVMVIGHSAGGAIAAVMCLMDREQKQIGLKGLIIDYAPLRQSLSPEDRKALDPDKAIAPSRMVQYINWYFEDLKDMDHIYASPVLADLHDLPRTLVIAAEYDSLSEEDRQFAEKAEAAGVDTTYVLFPKCQHGFTHEAFSEYRKEDAQKAWNLMASFIKETVHRD